MHEKISDNFSANHRKTVVSIPFQDFFLSAYLYLPENPVALILFSHGSGSSRFSPRNNYVAENLFRNNMAALLADLLTPKEDAAIQNRFNISLLTERLKHLTQWTLQQPQLKNLPIGYFGASTGAASAINAAAFFGNRIKAVVSRGGRPDLASENALESLQCPTLFIIGSLDNEVITLNQKAFQKLKCTKQIEIVQGASHLFEETGKLHAVSQLAERWFEKYLIESVEEQ
ncbi:MAG: dienelactone hydrolase family protein [Ginsengibacter sp.]